MKLLLCLLLCCILVEGRLLKVRVRNDHCLRRNRYMHESYCRHKPRRTFYAFHRLISDCVLVTTNCPKMHKFNEYSSREDCLNDCFYWIGFMSTTPKITTTTSSIITTTVKSQ